MSVLSLADAKKHLNMSAAVTTNDTELQAIIDAAEAAIAAEVGPLEPTTITTRVRANGGVLALPVLPVVDLTTVSGLGVASLTVADLYVDETSGVVSYLNSTSAVTTGIYDVTYRAGRAECPANLLLAVKELVRHLWEPQRGPTSRPGSRASDVAANTLPGAGYLMPFRVQELLAPYMLPGFA